MTSSRLVDLVAKTAAPNASGAHVGLLGGQAVIVAADGTNLYMSEAEVGGIIRLNSNLFETRTAARLADPSLHVPIAHYPNEAAVDTVLLRALTAAGMVGGEVVSAVSPEMFFAWVGGYDALLAHPRTMASVMAKLQPYQAFVADLHLVEVPALEEGSLLFTVTGEKLGILFSTDDQLDLGILVWASGAHHVRLQPVHETWHHRLMFEDDL